jgi:hypothetical protein
VSSADGTPAHYFFVRLRNTSSGFAALLKERNATIEHRFAVDLLVERSEFELPVPLSKLSDDSVVL